MIWHKGIRFPILPNLLAQFSTSCSWLTFRPLRLQNCAMPWFDASNAAKDIYLIISSGGGNVFEGLSIAAFIKTLPVQITTHNIGQTDSIANVIFAAGSRRIANANASFMFHGVSMHYERQDFIESQLQEQYEGVKRLRESIAVAFAGYTGISIADVQSLIVSGGTIISAQDALAKTIIHEIKDANIPNGSQVIAIGNG